MRRVDVVLVAWPDPAELGGPRLLGRLADIDVVDLVRERIAAVRRRELAQLEPPIRLVEPGEPGA